MRTDSATRMASSTTYQASSTPMPLSIMLISTEATSKASSQRTRRATLRRRLWSSELPTRTDSTALMSEMTICAAMRAMESVVCWLMRPPTSCSPLSLYSGVERVKATMALRAAAPAKNTMRLRMPAMIISTP